MVSFYLFFKMKKVSAMKKNIFWVGVFISLMLVFISEISSFASGIALLLGIAFSSFNIIDRPSFTSKFRKLSLNSAVVLFGFGLSIQKVINVGSHSILQTLLSLSIIIICGFLLIKIFKLDDVIGKLITFGTAICGGSAIAATAPLLNAEDKDIGVATGVVFLLNTIALFLFGFLANNFALSAEQFGTWAALAIHDTSSVIGAASIHSNEALQVATITKLTRTLWIIPIVLILAFLNKGDKKISFPYFILFFIAASIFSSIFSFPTLYSYLGFLGKMLLALALYLIGTSLNPTLIKQAGLKSISMGISLWIISIVVSYYIVILF